MQPNENILEIGCGNGHAVELICKQLTTGKIIAIDRSAKAIRAAEANNQQCVNSGKVQFRNTALAEIKRNEMFDKIFAINVNVFWTGPEKEIAILNTLMSRNSRLYLFYDPPSSGQPEKAIENCKKHLKEEELEIVDVLRKRLTLNYGVCIMAKKVNA